MRARPRLYGRRLRGVSTLLALAVIALAVGRAEVGTSAPPALRVAPGGSDSCTRGGSTACETLSRALSQAQPGDVVEVAAGTYPKQRVLASKNRSGPAVTFRCARAHACVLGGLVLGQNSGSPSGDAPGYVTFDGLDVHGSVGTAYNQNSDPAPTRITIANSHIWSLDSDGSGILAQSVDHFTLRDVEIGPRCCGGNDAGADGIEFGVPREGAPSPSNIVLSRVYIHDLFDSCSHVPTSITAKYGGCSGTGYGDGCSSCDHVDGIQVFGAHGFLMDSSRIYNVNSGYAVGQGLFMQEANGGSFSDVTIQNSMFGDTPNNDVSMSGPGEGSWSGYVHVYYNTIQGNLRLYGSPGSQIFRPGTSIVVAGNIVGNLGSSNNNSCSLTLSDGSRYTPTYRNNLAANQTCGSSDIRGAATFVDGNRQAPNLHLARSSAGIGRGAVDLHPAVDIDGKLRPLRVSPDIGASQHENALVAPRRSLGSIRIGMQEQAIAELYGTGRPLKVTGERLKDGKRYRGQGGWLDVAFDAAGRAVRLATGSSYYSTRDGIGPGSTVPAGRVRKLTCGGTRTQALSLKATPLELAGAVGAASVRVTKIVVSAPGYGACSLTTSG